MKHLVMTATVALALSHAVFAADTDYDRFAGKVGKYAMEGPSVASSQPKGLCVCQDGSDYHGYGGALQRYLAVNVREFVGVRCMVQGFDSATGRTTLTYGCPTWVPLAK